MKPSVILFVGLIALSLGGCSLAGVATGAGATVGVAASQEGGLSKAATDARIQLQINELWFSHDIEMFRKIDMTVNQSRVLLTGVVQNPEHRVEAVRLAWQPKGVAQVINEIRIAESAGIVGFARDAWITGRLRTALTFDKDVLSINYSIDTVQGSVYLMGFAQNRLELNRVIETARTIPNVVAVVSYVKLVGQGPDGESASNGAPLDNAGYGSAYGDADYSAGAVESAPLDSGPVELAPVDSEMLEAPSWRPLSQSDTSAQPPSSEQLLSP